MIPAFTEPPLCHFWPFWVLELGPECSDIQVEKAAREITAKLALGVPGAADFQAVPGTLQRDEALVREARNLLLDPDQRLLAEFWYIDPGSRVPGADENLSSVDYWRQLLGLDA
ncbi:MAG: hypothetical protein QNJ40_10885 [Xanthomonadales bacterium]|nr:hypothetical protein [Xanthomonadales bacterium]